MKKIIIILFIILALGADLKVTVSPYIHWILWGILIFPLIIRDISKKGIVVSPMFGIAFVLILTGMISSFFGGADFSTVVQIVKVILILLTLYYFIYYSNIGWNEANISINTILIINFVSLFLGVIGVSAFSSLMTSDGRWGTFMAYPGSLVKIGVLGLYFNFIAFLIIKDKKLKLLHILLSFISLFVIYMDGSRTGMLILILTIGIIYILYFLLNHKKKIKLILMSIVGLGGMGLVVIFNLPVILQSRIGISLMKLLNTDSISSGLELIDSARFMMIETALNKIAQNPFIGNGAFSTVGVYADGTSMVVHNTYLQFWGDFGIIGILGLLLLYLSWIFWIPKIAYKIQVNKSIKDNILVSFSILMLCYFILNGLFHPYSTELSEWIIFIIPITYCYNYYRVFFQKE